MKYSFLPEAQKELDQQVEYYERKQPNLGEDFIEEVLLAISRAMNNPKAWPEIAPDIRRCLIHRFPYGILYHFIKGKQEIVIVAIMSNHRKPGYWKDRI